MRLETSGDNPFTTSAVYWGGRASVLSNSVGPLPQIQEVDATGNTMHWARKVGIGMCFIFMPAIAPLWALAFNVEVQTMIRVLTILFVPGLLLALGGKSMDEDQ